MRVIKGERLKLYYQDPLEAVGSLRGSLRSSMTHTRVCEPQKLSHARKTKTNALSCKESRPGHNSRMGAQFILVTKNGSAMFSTGT